MNKKLQIKRIIRLIETINRKNTYIIILKKKKFNLKT